MILIFDNQCNTIESSGGMLDLNISDFKVLT